jgi:Alpha-(1->3)-arabinofuranosyltransferase
VNHDRILWDLYSRVESSIKGLRRVLIRNQTTLLYATSGLIVLVSYLLWYNFRAPPISSNIGFNLFPWRQVGLSGSPLNPYTWPGTNIPSILGAPDQAYYGLFFSASGGSYSAALFLAVVSIDVVGALCLFYLLSIWLARFQVPSGYALFGVLAYAFNAYKLLSGFGTPDGYFSAGYLTPDDPAILVILTYLTFLVLFRSRRYVLLLGAFSVLAFSDFPEGTLILTQEYLVALAICFAVWWTTTSGDGPAARVRRLTKELGLIIGAIVVANAYLIYPLVIVSGQFTSALASSNPSYAFSYGFDSQETLSNSVRLITNWAVFTAKAPPWATQYLDGPVPIILSCALPALALSSVVFLRRRSDRLLYLMMLGVLWLSSSVNTPLGSSFQWATTNVLPFRAFYNGETFTPILLMFYCFFATLSIARIGAKIAAVSRPSNTPSPAVAGSPFRPRARIVRVGKRFVATGAWPVIVAVLLVASVYPALTPAYSQSHSSLNPVSSTLPPYYGQAADYLHAKDPNGPTMVFPLVQPFDSNAINGSTWYTGIDLYPTLIPNPSISSEYPYNYIGSVGTNLTIPGFLYDMGGPTCASSACLNGGQNPLPDASTLFANQSMDYVTSDSAVAQWRPGFSSDTVSFSNSTGQTSMAFRVNATVEAPNGHWLLGFLPSIENLSRYSFAVINFSVSGAPTQLIQFGYHSFTNYSAGNGYYLGDFSIIAHGATNTVIIPLDQPSIVGGGTLDNVTNLFFVDDSQSQNQTVILTVQSLRFIGNVPYLAPVWKAGTPEDRVSILGGTSATGLSFGLDKSVFEPNGHWALGFFPQPVNLAGFDFALINYTLSNANPDYLQFGYHSFSKYGPGEGFRLSDYLTFRAGSEYSSLIPLAAPDIVGGGLLSNATDLFFVYTAPGPESGYAYVNITSIRLSHGDPQSGLVLASALDRLGIEFAYVDTSIVTTNYPAFAGDYYNEIFGASNYFSRVFTGGTVTIYRNLLYSGLVVSPNHIDTTASTTAEIGGLSVPDSGVYYNLSNRGIGYVPAGSRLPFESVGSSTISNVVVDSSTEVSFDISSSTVTVAELKLQFSNGWVAQFSNGTTDPDHFEVDGFANGWLLPPGTYRVVLSLSNAPLFAELEFTSLCIPPILLAVFVAVFIRSRRRNRNRMAP